MEIGLNAVFITGVLQIIAIDLLLGGDNAVVIALACRNLPPEQRKKGIFWGVFGAIFLRIVLIFFALHLLMLPYVKIIGGLLLLWIGIKLLQPDRPDHSNIAGGQSLWSAIKTIIVADAVMSIDNIIAVSAAAHGHMALVIFGIAVSIPIIIWGSQIILKLLERFPIIVYLGGGLLGWIGGQMLITDPALASLSNDLPSYSKYISAMIGAVLVVAWGYALACKVQCSEEKNTDGC